MPELAAMCSACVTPNSVLEVQISETHIACVFVLCILNLENGNAV